MICLYLYTFAQIILESLPVSSSGHLQLLSYFCPLPELAPATLKAFVFFLHLPTACIVMLFFRRAWIAPLQRLQSSFRLVFKIALWVASASIITGMGYLAKSSIGLDRTPLWVGFLVTSFALASLFFCRDNSYEPATFGKVLLLGLLQTIALLLPGASRFALTFVGARHLRICPRRAFELSFLIEWPLILFAGLYGGYILSVERSQLLNPMLVCVMLCSSGIAYAALAWQERMAYAGNIRLWAFYMLIPFMLALWLGV